MEIPLQTHGYCHLQDRTAGEAMHGLRKGWIQDFGKGAVRVTVAFLHTHTQRSSLNVKFGGPPKGGGGGQHVPQDPPLSS